MEQQNQGLIDVRQVQQDQKDNLLSEIVTHQPQVNTAKRLNQKQTSDNITADQKVKQDSRAQPQIFDPIQQLIKNNNIMPLVAVIDKIDLNRKISQKPLLCIMATKFIPLSIILKDRHIQFSLDQDRRSPLHYAIQANDLKAAAWLIQKGNPNQQDNFGNTPILDAIRLGRRRAFLLCLKNKFYDQRAPLFAAIHNRHWELKVMYGMKINIFNYRDQQNKSSYERALQNCSFQCAQFMIKIKPDLPLETNANLTQSKGLIRRLKRIRKQNSLLTKIKNLFYPFIIMFLVLIGLNFKNIFSMQDNIFPYDNTKPFYYILIGLLISLYGFMYIFGIIIKGDVQYGDKNSLSQILMQPNYQTLEQICPVCVHFTHYKYGHCFDCGKCIEKYHFHSFVCVNKSNQVFWVLSQIVWLFLSSSLLSQFNQFIIQQDLSISSVSSFKIIRLFASVQQLYFQKNQISILWLVFLLFLFLYQLLYIFLIFGMMCMRRKYPEVINTEKYIHLYELVKVQECFLNRQQKIFKRGFFNGIIRCLRNALLYFFLDQ